MKRVTHGLPRCRACPGNPRVTRTPDVTGQGRAAAGRRAQPQPMISPIDAKTRSRGSIPRPAPRRSAPRLHVPAARGLAGAGTGDLAPVRTPPWSLLKQEVKGRIRRFCGACTDRRHPSLSRATNRSRQGGRQRQARAALSLPGAGFCGAPQGACLVHCGMDRGCVGRWRGRGMTAVSKRKAHVPSLVFGAVAGLQGDSRTR